MTAPATIIVYNFDPATGEYRGSSIARQSPKESSGIYLLPANSTEIAPPSPVAGKAVVFTDGTWIIVDDNREIIYYDASGNVQIITMPGMDPDPSWTTTPPAPSSAALLSTFKTSVSIALASADRVMLRVQEAITLGLNTATGADVVAYVTYRRTLRALMSADAPSTLPTPPTYPEGT